jgi:hypothetical protein
MRSRAGFELGGLGTREPTPHNQLMALARNGLSSAASVDGKAVPHALVMSDGTPVLLLRQRGRAVKSRPPFTFNGIFDTPDLIS